MRGVDSAVEQVRGVDSAMEEVRRIGWVEGLIERTLVCAKQIENSSWCVCLKREQLVLLPEGIPAIPRAVKLRFGLEFTYHSINSLRQPCKLLTATV